MFAGVLASWKQTQQPLTAENYAGVPGAEVEALVDAVASADVDVAVTVVAANTAVKGCMRCMKLPSGAAGSVNVCPAACGMMRQSGRASRAAASGDAGAP